MSGWSVSACMIGSSVVPGLPKMWSMPSALSNSMKALRPLIVLGVWLCVIVGPSIGSRPGTGPGRCQLIRWESRQPPGSLGRGQVHHAHGAVSPVRADGDADLPGGRTENVLAMAPRGDAVIDDHVDG